MKEYWQCEVCGTIYAEYVNGCPCCWEKGIRAKVSSSPEGVLEIGQGRSGFVGVLRVPNPTAEKD